MSAEAQIEALLEIINTSARQAIAEYKKDGNQVPTIHSRAYHPIDFATDTVALKKAVRLLEGACQQLCASLAPPQHTLHNFAASFDQACVGIVLRGNIADVLEKYPNGLHVDELGKLVSLEKGKLARVLRLLATKGCFTEVEPNVFANNRVSLVTLSSSDASALWRLKTRGVSDDAAVLYKSMTELDYATSYDPNKAPIIEVLGQKDLKGGYFHQLEQDAESREKFHHAMIGFGHIMGSLSVLHHYPWNEVKSVCDVGASFGTFSIPLSKMYPHLKITNQDLPQVLIQAKDIWDKDAPGTLENNQVELVPLNFLLESPVGGLDVYYLQNIIHNWRDADAAIIMRNVRKAMAPHSRLLIQDYVLIPACRDPNAKSFGSDTAPEPLLANFGSGNHRMYQQDMSMWFFLNAKERTLNDLVALGSASGLRLEKVYDLAESAAVEFRVA